MHDTTADTLRDLVVGALDVPPDTLDDHTDLITCGLDSIAMMRLAGRLRKAGHQVVFADLVAQPTLAAWRSLLSDTATPDSTPEPEDAAAQDSEPFDLAGMQHAYWVGRDPSQPLGGVGAHFYHEFDGPEVDPARLERAVRTLFARHEMLRARFTSDGRQQIDAGTPWTGVAVRDLRDLDPDAAERAVRQRRDLLSHRLLDVAAGEVFDVGLTLLPGGRSRLHVNLDMLVADAVSFRTLLAELAVLYEHPDAPLPPIRYSFRRYLAGRSAPDERHRAWWRERVPDLPGAPDLPVVTEPVGEHRILRRHHWLDGVRFAALGRHAAAHAVTPAMAMATCFGEVVAAWSAQPRFLLNVPMFGREQLHPDVDLLVGDFTGSVLLEFDARGPATFAERTAAVQDRFRADAAHAEISGVEVLRELSRAQGRQVIAPVVLTSALNLGELYTEAFRRSFGSPCWIVSQGPQVWLDAQVTEMDGGLLVNWDALDQAFPDGMLDAMFGAFRDLVEELADGDGWDRPVPNLLPAATIAVREACNATGPGVPGLLHEAFFARAGTEPDRIAVAPDQTYGALAASALRIAGALVAAGVAPGDAVAVGLPKGPDQVRAVLGVLAAGAAYVPVGVDQPPVRRDRIAASAAISAVITDGDGWSVPVVRPDASAEPLAAPVPRDPDDPAYVLFTSGSTGEPKGVVVPHRAASNTVDDLCGRFALGPDDRTLALSALDFDLSVFDLFAPLSVGGAVVLPGPDAHRDAGAWRDLCRDHGVTVLNCVPALLDMVLASGSGSDAGDLAGLRLVLLGGDWVGLDLPPRLAAQAPGARFVALGGTTETAIHSTVCDLGTGGRVPEGWRSIPYGTPLRGVALRVVDGHGRDRPDHVAGELWIGGTGVADGYRGDPERTAAVFGTAAELGSAPTGGGTGGSGGSGGSGTGSGDTGGTVGSGSGDLRWYRTGDLARYWPDGTVEFLGRADAQVKVRGHRIELGEIEAALELHPQVGVAVAGVVPGAADRLAAAVTGTAAPDELPGWLATRLPGWMVPDTVTRLDAMPLTANGKVDRGRVRARLAETRDLGGPSGTPPVGPVETVVAREWAHVLDVARVHREDGFFALGGDSLIATRLLVRLRRNGITGATIGGLFTRPVLADFAAGLGHGDDPGETVAFVADPEHAHDPFGPTDVQRAYWMGRTAGFTLGGVGCHFYREYDVPGLDVARLEHAVNVLVARHGALRTVFDERGDQQVLPAVGTYRVPFVDGFAALRAEYGHRVFDPGVWPLFTVAVAREDGRTRVGIGLDNLVLDALSVLIFYAELGTLYADPDADLPPVELTFRDYLRHAVPDPGELAVAEAYWAARAPELPPPPQLPLARDPSLVTAPRFTRRETRLDARQWAVIVERARAHGLTPSAVLLTAFAEVLGTWSSRRDLTVDVTLFDRADVHPGVGRVLGDFTSLLLVAARPPDDRDWVGFARRVQEDLSAGLDHRQVSAVWVQRELGRLAGNPEFSVPVVFTSAIGMGAPTADVPGEQVYGISQTPQVWLDHQVTETADGGVALNWDAVEELFCDGVLDAMFDGYRRLLDHLGTHPWTGSTPDLLPNPQRTVRAAVNDTAWTPPETVLHAGFFREAAVHPDAPALIGPSGGSTVSYGALADRALRVARHLVDAGVRPGDPVTVTLPRGVGQVAALLGVLAAGGAYVPVSVDQPPARRERIRASAGSVAVIDGATPLTGPPLDWPVAVTPDQLAYVIFTSGSTGEPKGVEITHRAAANTVADLDDRFGVGPHDRVLAVSGYDFDLSVYDVFGVLGAGGAVVLVAEDDRRDAARWVELVRAHSVTVWNSVPALLDMLLVMADGRLDLRLALVSGDWIAPDLPERLAAVAPECRFVALGGATEASIWSNAVELTRVPDTEPGWRSAPYGFPLRGQRFRVVDDTGRDRPDWVSGELWIGGTGLARGYRGAPEQTARAFVTDAGARWYRTGDQGRYRPDGCLEFLGRTDDQVKIRGHRIELGEIDAALVAQPGVGHAVTVVAGDGASRRLAAAVVPAVAEGSVVSAADADPDLDRWVEPEARAAEAALARMLRLDELGGTPVDLAARWNVADRHRPVLRLWLDWLVRRGVLVAEPGGHRAGRPPHTGGGHAHDRLVERVDDYRDVLAGRIDPVVLLDDPVLAPERLADAEPGAEPALASVAAEIAARVAVLGRPVDVVELDGRSGLTAARLLAHLDPGQVRYTLLEASAVLRAAATALLAGSGHGVTVRSGQSIEDTTVGDVVLAHNVLHRETDPADGPARAALRTRPGGMLCVLERVALTPVALLTATLLDGGYEHLDPARRRAGSPMLGGLRWAELLARAGFDAVVAEPVAGSPLVLVRGTRPAGAPDLDPSSVRRELADRLPAHMVPDRVTVLASLPLTGNGKVDRATVTELVAAPEPHAGPEPAGDEPPRGADEEFVAAAWAELLDVPAVGRSESFLALGGDSLLATRFLERARHRYGVTLALRHMFAAPTVAEVAWSLAGAGPDVEEGAL